MRQASLGFDQELVVDLFAGGGGASLGIARAYREPDVAVNHDPIAIAIHTANHPSTLHYTCDVFEVHPLKATAGRPVGLLWASPDCRHHSKAKGGKPRSKRVRGLAWVVTKWAAQVRPRVIALENVEEFADWGPLLADGTPCPLRKGFTYRRWIRMLEKLGYKVESREIRAMTLGTPTIRKRLYVIARRDGLPIIWPKATHGPGLEPYKTAADCIDWSIPTHSVFLRSADAKKLRLQRPLKPNTLKRVVKGVCRYVIDADKPFIIPMRGTHGHTSTHAVDAPLSTVSGQGTHHALVLTEFANASAQRNFPADEPLRTQCAQVKGGHFAAIVPTLVDTAHSQESPRGVKRWGSGVKPIDDPMGTVQAGAGNFALSAATLMHVTHHGERAGQSPTDPLNTVTGANRGEQAVVLAHVAKFRFDSAGASMNAPLPTITAGGDMARDAGAAHALGMVTAHLEQANGGFYDGDGRSVEAPMSTIMKSGSNQRLVSAHLIKYYGTGGQWQDAREPMHTVPTKGRMAVVETVSIAADALTDDQWRTARACAALLRKYAPERFPVAKGEKPEIVLIGNYILVDIGLRMLTPRELARAQGFPDDYLLEWGLFDGEWRATTKTQQVKLIGNSVCPQVAEALVRANLSALLNLYRKSAGE